MHLYFVTKCMQEFYSVKKYVYTLVDNFHSAISDKKETGTLFFYAALYIKYTNYKQRVNNKFNNVCRTHL